MYRTREIFQCHINSVNELSFCTMAEYMNIEGSVVVVKHFYAGRNPVWFPRPVSKDPKHSVSVGFERRKAE